MSEDFTTKAHGGPEGALIEQPERDELPAETDGHADDSEAIEDSNPEGLTNADVA